MLGFFIIVSACEMIKDYKKVYLIIRTNYKQLYNTFRLVLMLQWLPWKQVSSTRTPVNLSFCKLSQKLTRVNVKCKPFFFPLIFFEQGWRGRNGSQSLKKRNKQPLSQFIYDVKFYARQPGFLTLCQGNTISIHSFIQWLFYYILRRLGRGAL